MITDERLREMATHMEGFHPANTAYGVTAAEAQAMARELLSRRESDDRALLAAAPASPEPSPSTEDVMREARGALAIALSAIEKAGDDLQASGAYPVGALAALIVPAEQVRTAITNIDRAQAAAPTHRHKKRGSEYVLIGFGRMQAGDWFDGKLVRWEQKAASHVGAGVDMREVAVYRSVDDGSLWVRPREEFEDGRFEDLRALSSKQMSEKE